MAQDSIRQNAGFPYNGYKSFTGTVAGHTVQVYLTSLGGRISGWYAQEDQPDWPVRLKYESQKSRDSLLVFSELSATEKDSPDSTAPQWLWQCIYREGALRGKKLASGALDAPEMAGVSTKDTGSAVKSALVLLKEAYPAGTYPFAIRTFNQTFDGLPGNDSKPQWETTYVYPVATSADTNALWINRQIKTLLNGNADQPFDSIINGQVRANLKTYREEMRDMKKSGYGLTAAMNYETMLQIYIDYNRDNYLVLNADIYEYAGGAHGNYGDTYFCYDVQQQKRLQLQDIITADSLTLSKLIEKQYRSDNQLAPEDKMPDIYDNQLPTTNNFYLNAMGIGFVYNPYEVAPYVRGLITVFIPYKKLANDLNPDFKKRMGIQVDEWEKMRRQRRH